MTIPECITSILIVYLFARLLIPVIDEGDREKQERLTRRTK